MQVLRQVEWRGVCRCPWAETGIDDIVGGPVIDAASPAANVRTMPAIW